MSKSIYENTRVGTGSNVRAQLFIDALRASMGKQIGCVKYDFSINNNNLITIKASSPGYSVEFADAFSYSSISNCFSESAGKTTLKIPYINTNEFMCLFSNKFIFWSCLIDSITSSAMSGYSFTTSYVYSAYRLYTKEYTKSFSNVTSSILSVANNANFFKSQADSIVCVPFIFPSNLAVSKDNQSVPNLYAFNVSKMVRENIKEGYEYDICGRKAIILRASQSEGGPPKMLYFYE